MVLIPLLTVPTVVRLIVSQGGRALHLVNDNQFLDSPEWFGVSTDEYFQVTVTALETSTILMWHRLVAHSFRAVNSSSIAKGRGGFGKERAEIH